MFVSKDGTVTGSVDVSKLDQIEAKTDEAKVQLAALKADVEFGQEQTARDAERLADLSKAQADQLRGGDVRDMHRDEQPSNDHKGEKGEAKPEQGDEAKHPQMKPADDEAALLAEAEAAGVTVDKRWGPDRLRQEIEQANTAKAASQRKR